MGAYARRSLSLNNRINDQAQMAAYADLHKNPSYMVAQPPLIETAAAKEYCSRTMPGPARTGVLIYAKNLLAVSAFYEKVLGAKVLHADHEHRVLQSPDVQLIIHTIPEQHSSSIAIQVPPVAREEQAIKPFFTVESLAAAERIAEQCGGRVWGPVWPGPGIQVRNVCDPEGNILHLRGSAA